MQQRNLKTNLQETRQNTPTKIDYDSLLFRDTLQEQENITPGKDVYKLTKRKSQKSGIWNQIHAEPTEALPERNVRPFDSSPTSRLNKTKQPIKSKSIPNTTQKPPARSKQAVTSEIARSDRQLRSASKPSVSEKKTPKAKTSRASNQKSKLENTVEIRKKVQKYVFDQREASASSDEEESMAPTSSKSDAKRKTATPTPSRRRSSRLSISRADAMKQDSSEEDSKGSVATRSSKPKMATPTPKNRTVARRSLSKKAESEADESLSEDLGDAKPSARRRSQVASTSKKSVSKKTEKENDSASEQDENAQVNSVKTGKRKAAAPTPKNVRYEKKRVARRNLSKVVEEDSESSVSSSEEDEEESNEQEQEALGSFKSYFEEVHGSKKLKTSDNTLSKMPVLDPQEYLNAIQNFKSKNEQAIKLLHEEYRRQFPQWYFELENGYNLLFYGYGSKMNLLESFCSSFLRSQPLLKINGFFPTIQAKTILSPLMGLIGHKGALGTIADQIATIKNYFSSEKRSLPCLNLLIHNIEGQAMRNDTFQTLFSSLAECENIRIIASVDHINAPFMWDHTKSMKFNWLWHDITSYEPYVCETTFENSILMKSTAIGSNGILYVLKSLNANARGIFSILARHQLGSEEESVMTQRLLLQRSLESFLVSNENAFKSLMTEFKDHKVMVLKKMGEETGLCIPLDRESLESIMNQMKTF